MSTIDQILWNYGQWYLPNPISSEGKLREPSLKVSILIKFLVLLRIIIYYYFNDLEGWQASAKA